MKTTESPGIPDSANLVLIGGGTLANTARSLLKTGLDLSGAEKPNVLLIPTPKNLAPDYEKAVASGKKVFGDEFGANVDVLHEFGDMTSTDELSDKLHAADLIYISGGNTRHALDTWRAHGVDKLLDRTMRQGKVMTGISAGALSWFNKSHSDSLQYEVPKGDPWDYIMVNGLGNIDTYATAHYNSVDTPDGRRRSEHFRQALSQASHEVGAPLYGLGIDNNAGLFATGGLVSVLANRPETGLHVLRVNGNEHSEKPLDAPRFDVDSDKFSIDHTADQGISWDDFYSQLSDR